MIEQLQHYINKTGFSFSFSVKATALKQQISKFYPHIESYTNRLLDSGSLERLD